MATPAADALPSELPTRVYHRVRVGLIALVVLIGGTATAVEWHQGNEATHRDDMAVARRAVDLVMGTAASTEAGLAGAGGLVSPEGSVSVAAFTAYVQEVTVRSSLTSLAYEPVVPETARAAYERALGRPITDRAKAGGYVPAAARPEHYPVRAILPSTAANRTVVGFDLAGDPVRGAAATTARDTGQVVFSAPTAAQTTGVTTFFIVKPLYRLGQPVTTVAERRAALVGFISTASVGSGLNGALKAALPAGTTFQLRDGTAVLAGRTTPVDGITDTVRAANRTWTLTVKGPSRADHGVAVLLGLLTALLAGGMAVLLQRGGRHERELRRSAELIARTADLAQALSAARTVDEVAAVVQDQLSVVLDAPAVGASTSIGVIEGDVLRVLHGPSVPADYRERFPAPRLDSELAFTTVARTGKPLIFHDQEAYAAAYPRAGGPPLGARAVLPLLRADGTTIGAMAHLWPEPLVLDRALLSTLSTVAGLTGQAIERTRLAQVQAEDARHTDGLARLAQGLASRTNSEAVMTFLTQGVLAPLDAFHAAVGVVEGSVLRRHFTPGELSDLVADAIHADTPLEADSPLTQVARLGEAVLLPDEASLRASYPHLVDAWLAVGFGATANLPLRDRQGGIIGALGVAWDHPVVFDADLRDRLSTVAGIAGQTIERAQLVDRIRGEARSSEALADLAEVLATARSSEEVAAAVVDHAAPVVGADAADVVVLDPATGLLRLGDEVLPRGAVLPHVEVMGNGGTLTFADRAELSVRFPDRAEVLASRGREASAVTALRDSTGRRVGAIGFEWDQRVRFHASRVNALRNVADLCSQAMERALLSDAEHRLATTLQDSVLAPLPTGAGLRCAARYLPAARSVGMGGDWYEGIVLDDGRYVVVVGDVAGHGITAVGQMAQFRSVIGALVRLDTPLEQLFPLATSVVQGIDPIASAIAAEIDVAAGTLRYSAAGHPPPLLRLPDGQVIVLDQGRQSLLGVPMPSKPVGEHAFPPGASFICYTDGLIERRGEAIDESVRRLASIVRRIAPASAVDPARVADELLEACVPERGPSGDDVAVAVITRDPRPGPSPSSASSAAPAAGSRPTGST